MSYKVIKGQDRYNIATTGSLTNNNGVLSGFDSSDYATIPINFNPGTSDFEIVLYGKVTDTSNNGYILAGSNNSTIAVEFAGGVWMSVNGGTYNLRVDGSGYPDVTQGYYRKFSRVGDTWYNHYSIDGENWVQTGSATNYGSSNQATLCLGRYPFEANTFFGGSIDLNKCYIKVNGIKIWEGKENTYRMIKEKGGYNIATTGNLTNDDGILSGFDTSVFASLSPDTKITSQNFEVGIKFTTASNVNDLQILFMPTSDQEGVRIEISGGQFGLLCGSNGVWVNTSDYTGGTVSPNTTYYVRAKYSEPSYELDVSTDGETYTNVISYPAYGSLITSNYTNCILGQYAGGGYFPYGSIDLSGCYIKLDGTKVWVGEEISYKVIDNN